MDPLTLILLLFYPDFTSLVLHVRDASISFSDISKPSAEARSTKKGEYLRQHDKRGDEQQELECGQGRNVVTERKSIRSQRQGGKLRWEGDQIGEPRRRDHTA